MYWKTGYFYFLKSNGFEHTRFLANGNNLLLIKYSCCGAVWVSILMRSASFPTLILDINGRQRKSMLDSSL